MVVLVATHSLPSTSLTFQLSENRTPGPGWGDGPRPVWYTCEMASQLTPGLYHTMFIGIIVVFIVLFYLSVRDFLEHREKKASQRKKQKGIDVRGDR